ncbi:T9SS type A sorting domain-containing protein [Hymenobacter monticola]|uniref:T9SS type A sorting domain-containing protein n=1 Tax=Hymenobacter monticola TaxID=1705399 RepID=A0ABY4B8E7_9BACT|nr:T9SS type A sorting domain-containing protein [Hymenobacter monticola]UOE35451.1 T9SS type A sorting domain-containing protein [Hymenobacter monticola]
MHIPLLANRLSRWLVVMLLALLSTSAAWAQSTANYAFTTSSTGSLVDMSTGTTNALATGAYRDDDASTVQPIGFTFVFMGTPYTQFSVNSNGQLRLGATVISGTNASPASGAAILGAFGGDNATQSTGRVAYKVVPGTNRTLVVEWTGLRIPYAGDPAAGTPTQVQVVLEENTGKIEYRYGAAYNNGTGVTRAIFISSGTSAGQIGVVKTFNTTPTYDATVTTATTTSLADNTAIAVLNSTADGSRTVFTFTPTVVPAVPTVALTAVTQTSLTVSITDNSTNEYSFSVLRSTDNVTFTSVGTVATSSSSGTGSTVTLAQAGLTANTTYYYKVAANGEGYQSFTATATATTLVAVPICGTKAVGPGAGADYATLTAAFSAIFNNGLCGPVVLELQSGYLSTAETFPLVYNYAGATATNTVTVRPAAGANGLSITGTGATAVMSIAGGKYLIIDGRPGGSGATVSGPAAATDLTISSTSTSGIPLQFTSDATFNTVQHVQIKGVGTSDSGSPDVNFTGTVTTTGNSDNTVQYCNIGDGATTPVTLIYGGNALNARNSILNNNLFNNYGTGSTYGVYLNQTGAGWVISGNSFYQTASRASVSGTMYGIFINANNGHTVSGNFVGGSAPSLGGTPLTTTGTSAYRYAGIYLVTTTGTATNVQGNSVGNITWASSSGASTTYGIVSGIYVSTGDVNIGTTAGNTIGGATAPITVTSSTTGGYAFGFSSASSGAINISGNTISNISGAGAAAVAVNVAGILSSTGSPTISRNKIYNLAGGSAAAGTVATLSTGIWLTGGTTTTVANNLIGDLRAATSTSLVGVTGLLVSGGTTVNAYYNTINLAATSTGATFGTSGIYLNSTSAVLDLRNNIVVNKSTAVGTGGYTAALRRVSGTAGTAPANLAAATNNNLYYAGTPSATNLLYVEGTTTATNATQTLVAYKALVAPRESNSVTEDVPFLSTTGTAATFLHINPTTPTQVESSGQAVSGITVDFDGDARNASTPDIGADEGTFTPLDLTGPTITFAALTSTASTANRTLAVTITDFSGVSTTTPPRLLYRKGTTGAFTSALATSVSGSTYTFTFDYAALGGVAAGDVIQYYVAAQDVPGNVSTSPLGGSFTTNPATVNQFTILSALSGVYYVGTSTSPNPARTFATLTAAANAYSSSGMSGAVTFLLLDNAYSATTGETFPVIFFNNPDASATNTLLIKPNAGATPVVTAAGSVLALASTRYVTIDGSNTANGTTRDLTLTNTTLTANTYGLGLLSQTGQAQANLFATVRNVNVVGGGATANATTGIVLGGADNDNATLQNNSIQGVTTGIQAFGSANTSVGGLDNLVITGNVIGAATAAAATNINQYGIVVASALSPVVSRNEVQNIVNPTATFSSNMTGILLQDVQTASVTRNSVHNLSYTGTSTAKLYGISTQTSTSTFNTAANASANRFDNNLVYALNSTATSASWNTSGINNNGGYGDRYYFNTVYLTGQLSNGSAGSAAFSNGNGISSTAATNIDVRNNIFSIIGGTGLAATPLYAHYTTLANYTGSTLNYNDLYVTVGATGVARIGRINSADATTLADWRTATGQEANSLSLDPQFVQTTAVPYDLTPANVALNNTGTPIAGVTVDYTGATRGTTPDIGAYEFTPLTNDLAPVALVAPATTSTCYGTAEPVSVTIRNAGTASLNFATSPATITVVVTLPGGGTTTVTGTVNTGTLAAGATQTVTLPGTLNMSTVGTYSFAITATVAGDGNTSNDVLTPAPTRTVSAPVAGTLTASSPNICVSGTATLALTGAANGTIQYQSSLDNVTFTDIAGATSAAYTTPVLTSTTYFRAQVRCNTGTATSNVSTITVSNPTLASTNTPVSICAGSTATLTATAAAGASVRFFSTATGGTPLASTTAGSYTTPALTADATYYAEAFTGGTERVGPADNTLNTGSGTNNNYALVFNVTAPTTLTGVYVYPTAAGVTNIQLLTSTGTVLQTYAATFTAANLNVKTFVPLNFPLPVGTGLQLANASTSTASLYRNTGGAVYPYTSPSGAVSITGNTFTSGPNYYYYFYDWTLGSECVGSTARTAIQVNVTQPATASFPAATANTCGTSAYTLGGTVGGSVTTGTYTTSGTGTFSPNATTLGATYTPSAADVAAGSVTITLTSAASGPCAAATASLVLSISPAPVASFSYPTATAYCAGSTGTVSPTLATGATAGTFTSTAGLSIDPVSGVISLANSTAGTYTVTNTIAASGACAAATATATVTITPATSAAFSYSGTTFCVTGTNPVATVTGTAGGTFSSATGLSLNATTGAISLSASTPGTYTVSYTVAGACGSSSTQSVTITSAPLATFSYGTTSTYCVSGTTNPAPSFGAGASGGVFSSATGLSLNATTGAINLSASTPGTYTVTNTIAANGGCAAATATTQVTITAAPVASFSYGTSTTFCVSGTTAPAVVLGTGATAGTFSSTTGLTINATTGAITLASSTPGTYTVTNTIAAANGCAAATATSQVTITAAPLATFSYATATGCVGSTSAVTPTLGAGASAGTFSSATGLTINATTGAINLATSTAGTYTVTNTVAASGGCAAATATTTFTVNPRPATPTISVAYNGSTTTLTSSATTGNQFYLNGTAVTGATGQTLVLTGLPAQLGSYTVTTTNANGCVSLPSNPLVVTSAKNGIAGASLRLYPNPTPNGQVTLELTGYRLATQLTVLDALGRVVSQQLLPAAAGTATHALDLTGVATGVYLLRLSNADGVETRRLVRE